MRHAESTPGYPLLVWTHFRTRDEIAVTDWTSGVEVNVAGTDQELDAVGRALWRCDGAHSWDEVLAVSGPFRRETTSLLVKLAGHRAIIDRHDRAEYLLTSMHGRGTVPLDVQAALLREPRWRDERVSGSFESCPSDLLDSGPLLRHHSLPLDRPIPFESVDKKLLLSLLVAAYGSRGSWKPVPSGGRMWPLTIHALIRREGQYQLVWFDDENCVLLATGRNLSEDEALALLVQDGQLRPLLKDGVAIILVSIILERSSRKYGNRSTAYALIEVGSFLQQLTLSAHNSGIATRAIGGIRTNLVREVVGNDPIPIIAVLAARHADVDAG